MSDDYLVDYYFFHTFEQTSATCDVTTSVEWQSFVFIVHSFFDFVVLSIIWFWLFVLRAACRCGMHVQPRWNKSLGCWAQGFHIFTFMSGYFSAPACIESWVIYVLPTVNKVRAVSRVSDPNSRHVSMRAGCRGEVINFYGTNSGTAEVLVSGREEEQAEWASSAHIMDQSHLIRP